LVSLFLRIWQAPKNKYNQCRFVCSWLALQKSTPENNQTTFYAQAQNPLEFQANQLIVLFFCDAGSFLLRV
ncbi:hypothetical protein V6237_20495, partial [Pseudoalteromonas carrageenovora]|uniref:hypothetical protein n=1 Tax=Pseudoalteromonas carrageenovora TaxID=227 RepID=UPI00311D682A